jgi:hypothetical protein
VVWLVCEAARKLTEIPPVPEVPTKPEVPIEPTLPEPEVAAVWLQTSGDVEIWLNGIKIV